MEEALVAHLLADVVLAALVVDRITWAVRPQGSTLPALVLTRIDGLPDYTMAGPSGLVSSRIQVDSWAQTYAAAKDAARAAEAALSGIDVEIGDGNSPATVTTLRGGFKQGERDDFEKSAGGVELYRVSQDFIIWNGQG
jgi:hypothetical protein